MSWATRVCFSRKRQQSFSNIAILLFLAGCLVTGVFAQDAAPGNLEGSLGDQPAGGGNGNSLGDYARKLRDKKKPDVQVRPEEAKELFRSVDEITAFASKDSGLPRLALVKRKMVGRAEVEAYFAKARKENIDEKRFQESQLVMKKLGMLPRDFDLNAFLEKNSLDGLGGFYSHQDKTMYLLNWIPLDKQKVIMAHELTHALQDQNFHLARYHVGGKPAQTPSPKMAVSAADNDETETVRRAVVEGQAMVVYFDYLMGEFFREYKQFSPGYEVNLASTPRARQAIRNGLENSYDSPVVFKNAPLLLKETSAFPYRAGLEFALDLLQAGGRDMAFRTPYAQPPVSTHQVLQPDAYLHPAPPALTGIPNLSKALGQEWVAFDSGFMGELDVQVLCMEYGRTNDIYTVARKWDGGAYVAVKKTATTNDAVLTTADLGLIYASRWKTRQAAERFAQLYLDALPKLLYVETPVQPTTRDCAEGKHCATPVWEAHQQTAEGPVNLELWSDNLLLITASLDDATIQKVRSVLLGGGTPARRKPVAELRHGELSLELLGSQQFAAFSAVVGREMTAGVVRSLQAGSEMK